ncbi:MAG: helix-turn-helix domain-containing protein [Pyrinomonadaceae bacterium]
MHYEEISPSEPLKRHVKCFWALKIDDAVQVGQPETVLPDGSLEIVFNLADRFRRIHADGKVELQPQTIVVGQMRRYVTIEPTGRVDLLGVRFHTAGAYHLFKCSLSQLTDKIVELDSILGRDRSHLVERIHTARSTRERVAIVENLLLRSPTKPRSNENVVEVVKDHIERHAGGVSIYSTARQFGVSQRQLERHFLDLVGVSPKFYSRIVRLQGFLAAVRSSSQTDLLTTALQFGFYDQPHFVREFTGFAGKSPTAFFRDQNRMADAFIGA